MRFYREKFSAPQMHMLEEHVLPWLKQWHVGFGLLGEQGIESIHAHFNSLNRTYRSMPEEVSRLKHLMKEHLLRRAQLLCCCVRISNTHVINWTRPSTAKVLLPY